MNSAPESERPSTKSVSSHCGRPVTFADNTSSSGGSTTEKLTMYPPSLAINTSKSNVNSTPTKSNKSKPQTTSPTTIMVNLNAKHLYGSRRDRMRPRSVPRKK